MEPNYGTSTRARVMGSYSDYNAYLRGCDFVPAAATATQRSTALWRQDPSRQDLLRTYLKIADRC